MKNRAALPFVMICFLASCNRAKQPPAGVPSSAVLVPGPTGGWWQVCDRPVQASMQVSCSIYNLGGKALYAEPFVAVDRGPIDGELKVDPTANLVGSSWINLVGGRILVPTSRAEELRRFLSAQGLH